MAGQLQLGSHLRIISKKPEAVGSGYIMGEFDGYLMWQWFSDFMGGIRFKGYIPTFASGQMRIEDAKHPCMGDLPLQFTIKKEEWYTYDKSPRNNVHYLLQ